MQLFHLGSSRYARQLTGEGARLFGGRWNQKGFACLYTSGSRSLCLLEYLANVSIDNLPPDLAITEYTLPDSYCRVLQPEELPPDWSAVPAPLATRQLGSALLADTTCVCFAVPSAIIPAEKNYILNPAADHYNQLKIVSVEPFIVDLRIKK